MLKVYRMYLNIGTFFAHELVEEAPALGARQADAHANQDSPGVLRRCYLGRHQYTILPSRAESSVRVGLFDVGCCRCGC